MTNRPHNPLLIAGAVHCDSNIEADHDCTGWFGDGWKWHACSLEPGHDRDHRCPCGHAWRTPRRRRNGDN